MASADESDGSVNVEIVQVATPGDERRQRVRDDLKTKRVELELRDELEGAKRTIETGNETIAELEAEVKQLRERPNDADEPSGEPAPGPLVPPAKTTIWQVTCAILAAMLFAGGFCFFNCYVQNGVLIARLATEREATAQLHAEKAQLSALVESEKAEFSAQLGAEKVQLIARVESEKKATAQLGAEKVQLIARIESEKKATAQLGAEKAQLIARIESEKKATAQLGAEKAQLIARIESEKENFLVKSAGLERKDELRQRELQRLEDKLQSMREKIAGCRAAMKELRGSGNHGIVHSAIKWVLLCLCFLGLLNTGWAKTVRAQLHPSALVSAGATVLLKYARYTLLLAMMFFVGDVTYGVVKYFGLKATWQDMDTIVIVTAATLCYALLMRWSYADSTPLVWTCPTTLLGVAFHAIMMAVLCYLVFLIVIFMFFSISDGPLYALSIIGEILRRRFR